MVDPVLVSSLTAIISMGAIVIVGAAGGALLYWLDGHTHHGASH